MRCHVTVRSYVVQVVAYSGFLGFFLLALVLPNLSEKMGELDHQAPPGVNGEFNNVEFHIPVFFSHFAI